MTISPTDNTPTGVPAKILPDETWYIPTGDLFVLAGDRLFRIISYFIQRESDIFRSHCYDKDGFLKRGHVESHPLHIDMTAEEFRKVCWLMMNPYYATRDADSDTWEPILRFAATWNCEDMKTFAEHQIAAGDLPDIRKLVIYSKYNCAPEHLETALTNIIKREAPLTDDEIMHLITGLRPEMAAAVLRARELIRTTVVTDNLGIEARVAAKITAIDSKIAEIVNAVIERRQCAPISSDPSVSPALSTITLAHSSVSSSSTLNDSPSQSPTTSPTASHTTSNDPVHKVPKSSLLSANPPSESFPTHMVPTIVKLKGSWCARRSVTKESHEMKPDVSVTNLVDAVSDESGDSLL